MKIKITYLDLNGSNRVLAVVVNIYGWLDIQNKLYQCGISDNSVISIERVLTATEEDTVYKEF